MKNKKRLSINFQNKESARPKVWVLENKEPHIPLPVRNYQPTPSSRARIAKLMKNNVVIPFRKNMEKAGLSHYVVEMAIG